MLVQRLGNHSDGAEGDQERPSKIGSDILSILVLRYSTVSHRWSER
jgi:hypothetical protein